MNVVTSNRTGISLDDNYCLNIKDGSYGVTNKSRITFQPKNGYGDSYTLEFDFYYSDNSSRKILNHIGADSSGFQIDKTSSVIRFRWRDSSNTQRTLQHNISTVTWYKIIISYERGVGFKFFLNGVKAEDLVNNVPFKNWDSIRFNYATSGISSFRRGYKVKNFRVTTDTGLISDVDAARIYNNGLFYDYFLDSFFDNKEVYQYKMNQKGGQFAIDSGNTQKDMYFDIPNKLESIEGSNNWKTQP